CNIDTGSLIGEGCGQEADRLGKDTVRSLQVVETTLINRIPLYSGHTRSLKIVLGVILDDCLGHILHDMQGDITASIIRQLIRQAKHPIGEQRSCRNCSSFLCLSVVRGYILCTSSKEQYAREYIKN